ncbi:peptidylprolyl isomerase [Bacteroidota bacterium]
MGMMAQMRSLAPWFIITVGGLFVLFMALSDSRIGDLLSRKSNNIGSVNGEEITYQDFSKLLEQYRQFQIQTSGSDIPESQQEALRDQVWESLISQKLMTMKISEYGLSVTDDEVRETLLGPNPPTSVTQYFVDSTGNFNREAYEAAIFNPQNKEAVLQVEDQVRQQLLQTKLQNYINSSVLVSDAEVERKFIDQNIKMSAQYVLVDLNLIPDSLVELTDEDLQDYYDEDKESYKVHAQRKVKYALFKKQATQGDSTGIKSNLEAVIEDLKSDTSTFKTYVEIYSEQPYSQDTLQLSKIPRGAQSEVQNSNVGDIIGPLLTDEGYIVYRIVNELESDDRIVRASHILFKTTPADADNDSAAQATYSRLVNGEDFESLAKEYSQDPGSAVRGGDLGWFAKGSMVKEFEEASFSGEIGVVQKPIKSQFGWHIIKVAGKSNSKYVLERIVNKINPSPATMDKIFEEASDFAYLAENDGFETVAQQLSYTVSETGAFRQDTRVIPGVGTNKALAVFTFENDIGDVSEVYKVPTGYVVVMVSDIINESYRTLDEVKNSIRIQALRKKKREWSLEIVKDIKSNIPSDGSLAKAKEIYRNAKIDSVTNFGTSGTIPGIGREFAFSEKALEMNLNEISEPFIGEKGSYIIKVTQRSNFDSTAFSIQKGTLRNNILQQKKSNLFTQWIQGVRKDSDIEDLRYRFYR